MFTTRLIFIFCALFVNNSNRAQNVFDAARTGDIIRLRALQKINSDTLFSVNENGFSPLLLATYRNQDKTVKFLIKQKVDVNQGSQEGTALVAAAFKGNITIAKMLLKQGANIDVTGRDGTTALIFATQNGDEKMIKLLLKNKANKNVKDASGKTALDYAKLSNNEKIKVIFD